MHRVRRDEPAQRVRGWMRPRRFNATADGELPNELRALAQGALHSHDNDYQLATAALAPNPSRW